MHYGSGKVARMPTDRSVRRLLAFALGSAAIFDVTGAVIYRVLRTGLPPSPQEPRAGPFQLSTMTIQDAHREAVIRARDADGKSPSA